MACLVIPLLGELKGWRCNWCERPAKARRALPPFELWCTECVPHFFFRPKGAKLLHAPTVLNRPPAPKRKGGRRAAPAKA